MVLSWPRTINGFCWPLTVLICLLCYDSMCSWRLHGSLRKWSRATANGRQREQ